MRLKIPFVQDFSYFFYQHPTIIIKFYYFLFVKLLLTIESSSTNASTYLPFLVSFQPGFISLCRYAHMQYEFSHSLLYFHHIHGKLQFESPPDTLINSSVIRIPSELSISNAISFQGHYWRREIAWYCFHSEQQPRQMGNDVVFGWMRKPNPLFYWLHWTDGWNNIHQFIRYDATPDGCNT